MITPSHSVAGCSGTSSTQKQCVIPPIAELERNIFSRLEKVSQCCETCKSNWKEWGKLIDDATDFTGKKPYEYIHVLIESLAKRCDLPKKFLVDDLLSTMQNDRSINGFLLYGLEKSDLYPLNLVRDESKMNKFIATLDDENITGSAKKYLSHFYSKIEMTRLNNQIDLELLKLHTHIHREYHPENNGLYPIIKTDGSEYKIKKIKSHSSPGKNDHIYLCSDVKPYISSKKTSQERSAMYDEWLVVKRLGNDNQLLLKDSSLNGQHGVFAVKDIPAHTCIGVHGGTILFFSGSGVEKNHLPHSVLMNMNQDYLVCMNEEDNIVLDGINIISKINSNFCQNNGEWYESSEGFNAKSVKFPCEMEDGNKLWLHAIFTTENIKKGQEIRMSYEYTSELVKQAMETNECVADTNSESLTQSIKEFVNFTR